MLVCFGANGVAQHRKQTSATWPKLELTATVLNSAYCSASNLRLTLQLAFHNTGSEPILLRKDGFSIGRYTVSADAADLMGGKYELNAAPMMNSVGILQYRFEGKVGFNESALVTLEPGDTHQVVVPLSIPFIKEAKQRSSTSLVPGDHVLQILVWTWLDSEAFATRLRKQWSNQGYLWTKSVISQPIQFGVTREKTISPCS